MKAAPSLRIVLIEDHQLLRELIAPLLQEELGCGPVATAGTVSAGIAACLRETPDFVIADWMLPDGRGFEILTKVREKLPQIRWLFMSSHEQGYLIREAVELKVHGFVMKRGPLDILRTAIREVSAGRIYYCPECSRLLVDRLMQNGFTAASELTPRELEVLRGFAMGENAKTIALSMGMSPRTVQNHLSGIREKLGLQEPAELVRYAIRYGLAEQP